MILYHRIHDQFWWLAQVVEVVVMNKTLLKNMTLKHESSLAKQELRVRKVRSPAFLDRKWPERKF